MKRFLYSLLAAGLAATAVLAGPTPLRAEEAGVKCYCVGGCQGYVYYNPCENGLCSWACNTPL